MRQIDVANRHCRYRLRTQPSSQISRHFRHGLIRNVHQKPNGLPWLQPEVARNETVPVRIDEVARYIFPQGKRRMPPQLPVAKTRVVLWSLVRPDYPAVVQSVAGQETLGSQHAVSVRVVKTLGVPSLAWIISLEPLYIAITAISQRILFWIECALLAPNLVQAIQLVDGPIQTALQALYDRLKLPVHILNVSP